MTADNHHPELQLGNATTRKLVYTTSWPTVGAHTVLLEITGTTSKPRVDIDAIAVLS